MKYEARTLPDHNPPGKIHVCSRRVCTDQVQLMMHSPPWKC